MFYVFLATGFEEVEALATVDVLRRAKIDVSTVGVTGREVVGAHKITVIADKLIDEINFEDIEGVILPGGMPGTTNLEKNQRVLECIKYAEKSGKFVCAICAAPSILGHLGVLKNKNAICYPGFEKELLGTKINDFEVVKDRNIITAKGPGVSLQFAFKIVESVIDKATAGSIAKAMQCV